MRTRIFLSTILAAALATALLAHPGPPRGTHAPGMLWEALAADYDQNQDGQITRDELGADATFELLDRNDDGVVSEDDARPRFERRMRRGPGPSFGGMALRAADDDDDGTVTSAEWQALFDELDADGDGEISEEELPMRRHRHRS